MAGPFTSALIDTYSHERFIERTIAAVLQLDVAEAEREILVADDGSTDRTPEIVRKFEPRVRLLRKSNGGQASAFNWGYRGGRGRNCRALPQQCTMNRVYRKAREKRLSVLEPPHVDRYRTTRP
jgi:glycosyltransferase involved in cell wall biosynthesis